MIHAPKQNQTRTIEPQSQQEGGTQSSRASLTPPTYSAGDDGVKPKFTNTGYDGQGEIGALSARYESNGNPGTVSTGNGDSGGVSYGSYQLASKFGNPEKFLNSTHGAKYKPEFGSHKSGTSQFSAVWRQIAARERDAFHKAQHDYIKESHYDIMVDNVNSSMGFDIDSRSSVLKDVAWSTAVQHGPRNTIFNQALAGKDPAMMSDEEIIIAVYAERGAKRADGQLKHFSRNSAGVQAGVAKRFISEQNNALNALFPDDQRQLSGFVGGKSTTARDWSIVQGWLVKLGYLTQSDIQADSQDATNGKTKAAITKFQRDNQGVLGSADGYVGRDTERALLSAVSALEKPTQTNTTPTPAQGAGTSTDSKPSTPTTTQQPSTSTTDLEMLTDITVLNNAMKGWGTDEKTVYRILSKYKGNNQKINTLKQEYKTRLGIDLVEQIHSEFSNSVVFGNELDEVLALIAITEAPKVEEPKEEEAPTTVPAAPAPSQPQAISASVGSGGVNKKADVVLIQKLLNNAGAGLAVDGVIGNKTIGAIRRYQSNFLRRPDGRVDAGGTTFRNLLQGTHKIAAQPKQEKGPDYEKPTDDLSNFDRPTYSGIRAVYGEPGAAAERKLKRISPAFPLYFAGSPVSAVRLHPKVADSFEAALKEVLGEYGLDRVKELRIGANYGGSFMNRPMRNGSSTSTHAWGIAVDFNASENRLRWGSDKALFAKPEYAKFLDIMEKHGWYNLGRYKNYDYMHFQAVKP